MNNLSETYDGSGDNKGDSIALWNYSESIAFWNNIDIWISNVTGNEQFH